MNRADLQRLSRIRLHEARSLFEAGLYSGAYYLSGYAVECALKSSIAKRTLRFDFPDLARVKDSYTHSLVDLLKVADLGKDFQTARLQNADLQASWDIVRKWSEQSRYEIWSQAEADAMIDAVGKPKNGVLPWLKLRW
jgi:HEPN domain-containing protein